MSKYISRKKMSKKDQNLFKAVDAYLMCRCDSVFAKIMRENPEIAAKAKKIRDAR